MKIKFFGGVQTVTGSCHLLTVGNNKILLDCGQFQGGKSIEKLNFESFGFNPSEINCVILSHAHIDHSGRIPLLVKNGFKGKIVCTDATYDLSTIMLKDSGYIHEKEAEWENRKNIRAGKPPIEPLYTLEDAEDSLAFFEPMLYGQVKELCDKVKIKFRDAGHILGSSIVELWVTEDDKTSKIVFSGDLGMKERPILRDPELIEEADYLIMETTYGNRIHPAGKESIDRLMHIILDTAARGGNVIIPSFAVGRTQELIYELNRFYETNSEHKAALDAINVYVDSPLATSATKIFRDNAQVFDDETRDYILKGDHPLDFKNLIFTRSSEESVQLNFNKEPKVIISASGMCDAGRIKHHLKHNLWNPKCSIVFVGYQAEGTLGKKIKDGEKKVTIFGEEIYVNAEIHSLEGLSGHADRPSLLAWLKGFKKKPREIFLVHGEEEAKNDFAGYIKEELGYDSIPVNGIAEYELVAEATYSSTVESVPLVADSEKILSLRERLEELQNNLEKIVYNTTLAKGETPISQEKAIEIENTILDLEKAVINLGSETLLEN